MPFHVTHLPDMATLIAMAVVMMPRVTTNHPRYVSRTGVLVDTVFLSCK
jgi:3-polyprenyl-4-hydroxybenzoate decarboxylase